MWNSNPVPCVIGHLLVGLVIMAHAETPSGEPNPVDSENRVHSLSARAKDAYISETERLLCTMREAVHKGELEAHESPNDWAAVNKQTADRVLGIYSGWSDEILVQGKLHKRGVKDGIVTPSAMSRIVFTNRIGFSQSQTRGIHEGVKLVHEWEGRIRDEYRKMRHLRLHNQLDDQANRFGTCAEDEPPSEEADDLHALKVPLAKVPSLEAMLYCYEMLTRFEGSEPQDNEEETEHDDQHSGDDGATGGRGP